VLGRPLTKFYLINMIKCIARRQDTRKERPIEEIKLEALVADDNELCRNAVVGLLEKQIHKITECENGKEAFEKLKTKHYDLAIIDYQMPEMNGIETIKKVREYERTHSVSKPTSILCIFYF